MTLSTKYIFLQDGWIEEHTLDLRICKDSFVIFLHRWTHVAHCEIHLDCILFYFC